MLVGEKKKHIWRLDIVQHKVMLSDYEFWRGYPADYDIHKYSFWFGKHIFKLAIVSYWYILAHKLPTCMNRMNRNQFPRRKYLVFTPSEI